MNPTVRKTRCTYFVHTENSDIRHRERRSSKEAHIMNREYTRLCGLRCLRLTALPEESMA